jgi:rhodanese-related sulfurtransferase
MSYRRMRIAVTISVVGAIVMATLLCMLPQDLMARAQVGPGDYGLSNNNYQMPGTALQVHAITIDELIDLTKSDQNYVIVDARPRDAYDKEHLPGAVSVPLDETDSYAGKFDKNQTVITYCGSFQCPISTKSAQEFMKLGFKNVRDYKGGIKEWKEKGYPVYGR